MPNYTDCTLSFEGEKARVEELLAFVKSDDNVFDLNKIIPMPERLSLCHGSLENNEIKAIMIALNPIADSYCDIEKLNPKEYKALCKSVARFCPYAVNAAIDAVNRGCMKNIDLTDDIRSGQLYLDNIRDYGCPTWYEWRTYNWGTKWNTCDSEYRPETNTITFRTAWAFPEPALTALSAKFPDVKIMLDFDDFEGSRSAGTVEFKNGTMTVVQTKDLCEDLEECDPAPIDRV